MRKTNMSLDDLNNKEGIQFLLFSLPTCGPCTMLKRVLEKEEGRYKEVEFLELDAMENMDLTNKFVVTGTPTSVILKNGEMIDRKEGFMPLPLLRTFLEKHVSSL